MRGAIRISVNALLGTQGQIARQVGQKYLENVQVSCLQSLCYPQETSSYLSRDL